MEHLKLNLVNPDSSDIKYKISKFPDGQQNISLEPFVTFVVERITILSRFNSFRDLELIVASVAALRRLEVKDIELYIPYVLGARSDRKFKAGECSYLVDVIAPILNMQNFNAIYVNDIHSPDVAAACIHNLRNITNEKLVRWAGAQINNTDTAFKDTFLVSPDGGSLKKIYALTESFGYDGDIITCSKHRDTDGKLTKTVVPITTDHNNLDGIIIDDICDGGRTFINIAKEIKKGAYKGKLYLVVTHGIFSNGFEELLKYFDGIFCTNSYYDLKDATVAYELYKDKVKQLNVFN